MKEQIVNGYQVLSDGRTCWVNAPTGESVARFSSNGIDVHRRIDQQRAQGACLDCRHGTQGLDGWETFKGLLIEHYQLELSDRHRPRGLK